MEMKKIEAETLEEAYSKAAKELSCSVTEINYEIIQHPTTGMMGLFKKPAIIIAVKKVMASIQDTEETSKDKEVLESENTSEKLVTENRVSETKNNQAESGKKPEEEVVLTSSKVEDTQEERTSFVSSVNENDDIVDDFFNSENTKKIDKLEAVKVETTIDSKEFQSLGEDDDPIANLAFDDDRDSPENRERSLEIENKLKKLIESGCFEIDTVEVDVFNGIAHIFIDGEDAALLIGKEGYRYNALSYMLFNWINSAYDLYIKLEIAEFIQTQEEMIDNYLKPIAEHIIEHGRGKTKPLDGILVQIALEKLRAMFPNKYIAIKTGKDGKKFILINNFNSQKNN
jgi:spoIIIJ-associated protein